MGQEFDLEQYQALKDKHLTKLEQLVSPEDWINNYYSNMKISPSLQNTMQEYARKKGITDHSHRQYTILQGLDSILDRVME